MIQYNDRRIVRHSPSQNIGGRVLFEKTVNDVDEVTLDGRLFHTREAAAGNARSPIVEWRIGGTMSVDADLNRCRESTSGTLQSSSAIYGGAVEWRQRYVSTASLKSIRCGTRSQCRSQSSGLTDSCFLVENTSLAAAYEKSETTKQMV